MQTKYGTSMFEYVKTKARRIKAELSGTTVETCGDNQWIVQKRGVSIATVSIVKNYISVLSEKNTAVYHFPSQEQLALCDFTKMRKSYMHSTNLIAYNKNMVGWNGDVALHELWEMMHELIEQGEWIADPREVERIMFQMKSLSHDRGTLEFELRELLRDFHNPLWDALQQDNEQFGVTMTEFDLWPLYIIEFAAKELQCK